MCIYNQTKHFETHITVILILKMENKNRERQAPPLEGPITLSFKLTL